MSNVIQKTHSVLNKQVSSACTQSCQLVPALLTPAVLYQGVAVVTVLALGTGVAVGVVQALEALAGVGVTRIGGLGVGVAAALTQAALASWALRVAVVTRGAAVTAGA